LDGIHREATALVAERRRRLQDPECRELVRMYKSRKQDLKSLQSKHTDLQHRSALLSEKVDTLRKSLSQFARETELSAGKLAKKPVRIRTDVADLPA